MICGYPIAGSPVTNIRAELLAATKAIEKCLEILAVYPEAQIMLLTDSAHVLQVLEGGTVGFAHVSYRRACVCCGTDAPTRSC